MKKRGLAALAAVLASSGCTTIERMNVNTVAIGDCAIERGSEQQGEGAGAANVLNQAGQAQAAFYGSLRTRVVCPSGLVLEADVEGEDVQPVLEFTSGMDHDVMLVRACAVFDPMFPTTGLGLRLPKDETGAYSLVASSAFVVEPA